MDNYKNYMLRRQEEAMRRLQMEYMRQQMMNAPVPKIKVETFTEEELRESKQNKKLLLLEGI